MVQRKTRNRQGRQKPDNLGRVILMTVPVALLVVCTVLFLFPGWKLSQSQQRAAIVQPEEGESRPSEWQEAMAVAGQAIDELARHLDELDRQVRHFETGRLKGTWGTGSSSTLLRFWDRWATDYVERLDATARSFEIDATRDAGTQPTPVHAAYSQVRVLIREVRESWEGGRGIEGLPARLHTDQLIERARSWMEKEGE